MADVNQVQDKANEAGFFAAAGQLLQSVRSTVNDTISVVSEPLMRDGMLGAAWRQGADEIFQGLKAFPDGIEGHASGTLNNPTQGEVADARSPDKAKSLDDILTMNSPYVPPQDKGLDQGREM
jgi:hypothetical protein